MDSKTPQDAKAIKHRLQQALSSEDVDITEVLRLSTQLGRLDSENVRFTTNAAHLNQIGLQLVARQETAMAEIVKNAYDADASLVEVTFSGIDKPGGKLHVLDNGLGMTREQLVEGFMRLSTTNKVANPVSPKFGRQRAGQKGIGRFSAQRLGRKLILYTQTLASTTGLRVTFNWDSFNTEDELNAVPNKIEVVPKDRPQGTLLIIEGLREAWSETQVSRVYRYVEELNQPYSLSKRPKNSLSTFEEDPGFKVVFSKMVGVRKETIASLDKTFEEYSLATIEGHVDDKGVGSWTATSTRPGISLGPNGTTSEILNALAPYSLLRDVHFKVYYFIYLQELIPSNQVGRIQDLAKRVGGVRLYRNGFRVAPYGELHSDWLNLDATYRARGILPPFSNNNFFGFIEINDVNGEHFQETASREGLIQNDAYNELVNFAFSCLKAAVLRIAAAREKKQLAGQKEWRPEEKAADRPVVVREVAAELELLADKLSSGAVGSTGPGGTTSIEVRQVAARLLSAADQLHELGMLRVLASLGLTIGEFTHEIMTRLAALRSDLKVCEDGLVPGSDQALAVDRLNGHFRMLESYAAYFNSTVSQNVRREIIALDLASEVRRFTREFASVIDRRHIKFDPVEIVGFDLYCRPMHPSEWASILSNFLTNSIKAIRRKKPSEGRILIRVSRDSDSIVVDFCDNGDGIPTANREKVFDAFFTTTNHFKVAAADNEELTGTGLGLKIVKDIVISAGGEIEVADNPPEHFSTCLRVMIPAATDSQINTANA